MMQDRLFLFFRLFYCHLYVYPEFISFFFQTYICMYTTERNSALGERLFHSKEHRQRKLEILLKVIFTKLVTNINLYLTYIIFIN